jgi:hypothetical protein
MVTRACTCGAPSAEGVEAPEEAMRAGGDLLGTRTCIANARLLPGAIAWAAAQLSS